MSVESYRIGATPDKVGSMEHILSISGLTKTYATGHQALKNVNLEIRKGEIFALLGPERRGQDHADQHRLRDRDRLAGSGDGRRARHPARLPAGAGAHRPRAPGAAYRHVRDALDARSASAAASSGCRADPAHVEKVLRDLSLWDKRDDKIMTLSGGMKRRVMIAKALAHEPEILFLDEPTAGVDVELRRDMWALVRQLRDDGVTIILTTHYIEEAEEMADRIGVINRGELDRGRGKGEPHAQAGQEATDGAAAGPHGCDSALARRVAAGAEERRQRPRVHVRRTR